MSFSNKEQGQVKEALLMALVGNSFARICPVH